MILKFIERNGKCHYLTADEFITQKVYCKDFGKDFFKEAGDVFADYNHMVGKIQEKTGFTDRIIDFYISDGFDMLTVGNDDRVILAIYPKSRDREHDIIVTDGIVFLMSDEGKTVDRLI